MISSVTQWSPTRVLLNLHVSIFSVVCYNSLVDLFHYDLLRCKNFTFFKFWKPWFVTKNMLYFGKSPISCCEYVFCSWTEYCQCLLTLKFLCWLFCLGNVINWDHIEITHYDCIWTCVPLCPVMFVSWNWVHQYSVYLYLQSCLLGGFFLLQYNTITFVSNDLCFLEICQIEAVTPSPLLLVLIH
jgi:hypothetical protein